MDTRLLEDVLLLLEVRNLSTAAARRHMTQPAFSRRIRVLEEWVGRDLLTRHANRVDISPALIENEPKIRAMLSHLEQLHSQLLNPEINSDPLVIATQHSLAYSMVPEIVTKVKDRNPNLRVRMRTQNRSMAMSLFLRHESDVLISYEDRNLAAPPFDSTVTRYTWRRDGLVPLVGGNLRYQLGPDNYLPENSNIITYPADSYFGQIIHHHQKSRPFSLDGSVAVESAFTVAAMQMLLAGIGGAWIPHSLVTDKIVSGDVVILSHNYGRIPLDVVISYHNSNTKARQFLKNLASSS